jgi:hypothetical protein
MNYTFSTRSERIAVIEDLRKPGIYFPRDWDPLRTQQRESELVFGFGFWKVGMDIDVFSTSHNVASSTPTG